jgi:ATP-binding cassette subfamily B protein
MLTPLPLKIAVDSVIGSQPIPIFLAWLLPSAAERSNPILLVLAAGLMVAIALASSLQGLADSLLRTYTSEKLTLAFRGRLFRHVQRLSLSYHDTRGTSDSTYRIQYDAPAIQWILIDGLIPFITAGLTLLGIVYVTARIHWQLAMVVLAISPVLFAVSRAYGPRLRSQWHEAYKLQSSAMSTVQEVLAALRVVKAFGQEEREQERFVRHSREGFGLRMRIASGEGMFGLWVGLTTALGMATVLFLGTRHVQSGVLSLGDLLMVMAYLTQLFGPLTLLSRMTVLMHGSLASAERAFALLDEEPDLPEVRDAKPLGRARGAVIFSKVSFAYGNDRPVLHDISVKIQPGARVGIAGTTGAGKSTLINLLTRFYDPTAGQILLDGVDLRDYKLTDLRNQFAIVLQEPVLFSTSIAENIAYARPDASMEDLVEAAKSANAHEFIAALPDGYDSLVGERGTRLSGGECQRVALARAFLKDAPILVLDEPTSSVDATTEAAILEAMERLMKGRTTFLVTHRTNTLTACDVLLRVENGRLVSVTGDESTVVRAKETVRS